MMDQQLVDRVLSKDKKSIARLISIIESERPSSFEYLKKIYSKTGNAFRLGITGPPGAGKSTITNQLTKLYLSQSNSVAIIAVDPTSPFTGGAVLGDRVRMSDIGMSDAVYIRSMATRGSLGGLSSKAMDCADVLDAAGFDIIIFETVGVGQSELDIAKAADTTIVTLVPESGDSVQAMKAGLMEIADIYVVNKFDRPEGEKVISSIQSILSMQKNYDHDLMTPIHQTIATQNVGIEELFETIKNYASSSNSAELIRKKRAENTKLRVKEIIIDSVSKKIWNKTKTDLIDKLILDVLNKKLSPYDLAENIIAQINL